MNDTLVGSKSRYNTVNGDKIANGQGWEMLARTSSPGESCPGRPAHVVPEGNGGIRFLWRARGQLRKKPYKEPRKGDEAMAHRRTPKPVSTVRPRVFLLAFVSSVRINAPAV